MTLFCHLILRMVGYRCMRPNYYKELALEIVPFSPSEPQANRYCKIRSNVNTKKGALKAPLLNCSKLVIFPSKFKNSPFQLFTDSNLTGQPTGRKILGEILQDRKSTRLNSSHVKISYAVFCLKKKKK